MKNILCYGDSNTYGFNPADFGRYDVKTRWTELLQAQLGAGYCVINEGRNNRVSGGSTPDWPEGSGLTYFPHCVSKYSQIDLVVIMLGSNDLQLRFGISPEETAKNVESIAKMAQEYTARQNYSKKSADILIAAPIHISEEMCRSPFAASYPADAPRLSRLFAPFQAQTALNLGANFIDMGQVTEPSSLDALHLSAQGHKQIADALSEKIKEFL